MADQNMNPVGCLGRVLTFVGVFWLVIVVLTGLGLLSELGLRGGVVAWVGGTFLPALLLLAAGRVLRRRGRAMEDEATMTIPPTLPTGAGKRVPTTRTERPETVVTPPVLPGRPPPTSRPGPRQLEPLPPPAPTPNRSLDDVIPPPEDESHEDKPVTAPPPTVESTTSRPKTSRELVEEARQKWGGRRKS